MNKAEWLDVCALISALWPHRPLPPEAANAWYPLLADVPAETVTAAVKRCALGEGSEWPPSVGQIREACMPPMRPFEDAIAEFRATASRFGSYGDRPRFEDEALEATVQTYGWRVACMLDLSNPTVRAQFRDSYRSYQRVFVSRRSAVLVGLPGVGARALTAGDPS